MTRADRRVKRRRRNQPPAVRVHNVAHEPRKITPALPAAVPAVRQLTSRARKDRNAG